MIRPSPAPVRKQALFQQCQWWHRRWWFDRLLRWREQIGAAALGGINRGVVFLELFERDLSRLPIPEDRDLNRFGYSARACLDRMANRPQRSEDALLCRGELVMSVMRYGRTTNSGRCCSRGTSGRGGRSPQRGQIDEALNYLEVVERERRGLPLWFQ